jgi:DTW domain-containing protein YfiP
VQFVLLDGSWVQANDMARAIAGWGRRINLPLAGASRYWLRAQAGEGRHSTVEALLAGLEHLGCRDAAVVLRAQFELHVYASLRARGHKARAGEYLATSMVKDEVRALLGSIPPPRAEVES